MLCTTFIQRFHQFRSLVTTASNIRRSNETNLDFLKNALGCDLNTWDKETKAILEKREKENLQNSMNTLKKLGYSNADISTEPRVLTVRSHSLLSRHRILCDYCFHKHLITTSLLRRFQRHYGLNVHELKRKGYIDKYKNVLGHMNKKLDINLDHLQETMSLRRIHTEYLVHYFMDTLCMSQGQIKYQLKVYTSLQARSFRCIGENVKFLTSKLNFDLAKIKKHMYVLYGDKNNMQAILDAFPKNETLDIRQIVYTYPKILLTRVHHLLAVIECLQGYGYTMSHIACIPLILVLHPATLAARLQRLHSEPWFKPYVGLPRALTLVFKLPGVEKRKRILAELNMKCVSINKLNCYSASFNLYAKHGRDKLTSVDGFKYLSRRLNVPQQQIFDKLKSHPYLRYVSLQQIQSSLDFLLETFSEALVYNNLQLVLYPTNVIADAFSKLRDPNLLDSSPCQDSSGELKHELLLPLALYVIEKESNFSGYGVWEADKEEGKSGDADIAMLPLKKRKRNPLGNRSL